MEIKRGFTLIELLIVIGIFSVLALVGTDLFTSVLRGSNKAQVLSQVKQNGQVALDTMERYVRSASNAVPGYAGSGPTLGLPQKSGQYVQFTFVPGCKPTGNCGASKNGVILILIGSDLQYLTNTDTINGVHVENATFKILSPTPPAVSASPTKVVEIELLLQQGVQAPTRKDFVSTITLKSVASTRTY